ncbi:YesL family protein [Alloscardovia criceti]|uniref:YesL family protein n=1 Tax=Alloscardovia criceti TaxID=356828 RepID=UPI00039A5682|nr:DUF624 domain-containing protein [Alloscardovia criceti]
MSFSALNILFVLTLIPTITFGCARTALYSTIFAYQDNPDIVLWKEYLKRFKKEFLPSLASSMIYLATTALILFSIVFWNALDTNYAYFVLPVLILATAIAVLSFEFHFPLLARYAAAFSTTWKNSLMLPWFAFGKTLLLLFIDIAFLAIVVYAPILRVVVVVLGFSWVAYAKSFIFLRIFSSVENANSGKREEKPDYSLPTASIE